MPMSLDFQEVEKVVKNSGGENQASNLGQTRAYLHRGGYKGGSIPLCVLTSNLLHEMELSYVTI